ncbi:hypothetical protein [Tsukamurella soli]|uniref:Sigma-70, region 4 n=1 Tax=Tsukamurella soli TaxID=644556 RepID=A0ABP8J7G7_9ACTN
MTDRSGRIGTVTRRGARPSNGYPAPPPRAEPSTSGTADDVTDQQAAAWLDGYRARFEVHRYGSQAWRAARDAVMLELYERYDWTATDLAAWLHVRPDTVRAGISRERARQAEDDRTAVSCAATADEERVAQARDRDDRAHFMCTDPEVAAALVGSGADSATTGGMSTDVPPPTDRTETNMTDPTSTGALTDTERVAVARQTLACLDALIAADDVADTDALAPAVAVLRGVVGPGEDVSKL